MKVRVDNNLDVPIHMMPGDIFRLIYHPPRDSSLGREKKEQVLLEEMITKELSVDYLAVLDLDDDELRQLGLTDALVGLFGDKEKSAPH